MALIGQKIINIKHCSSINIIVNEFHTSIRQFDRRWRLENRLPENPNAFGPLTNWPDYSFTNGKPVPYGVRQYNRIEKQRQILTTVKEYVREIDNAVAEHAKKVQKKENERKSIIEGKFKQKGQHLLTESDK